jgi:hypothetical protein
MPRRCAMNSSGRTVVLVSITTMSIATNQISRGRITFARLIVHTYGRNVGHHDSPQRICESNFRMSEEEHSAHRSMNQPHARSTFSKTKLTRSFLRSRMRTVGSSSSWACIFRMLKDEAQQCWSTRPEKSNCPVGPLPLTTVTHYLEDPFLIRECSGTL